MLPRYRLQPSEPAVFVELYLPKRAEYQGRLYETLTQGLKKEHITRHFLDKERRGRIEKFLQPDFELNELIPYTDSYIGGFPDDLFRGYSMYEVDGVYRDAAGSIYEERVQILRLVFCPPPPEKELKKEAVFLTKAFLWCPRLDVEYFSDHSVFPPSENDLRHLQGVEIWIGYMKLFVFGYVVFELCERIEGLAAQVERSEAPEVDAARLIQDEIWISSQWHVSLNRVVRRG